MLYSLFYVLLKLLWKQQLNCDANNDDKIDIEIVTQNSNHKKVRYCYVLNDENSIMITSMKTFMFNNMELSYFYMNGIKHTKVYMRDDKIHKNL